MSIFILRFELIYIIIAISFQDYSLRILISFSLPLDFCHTEVMRL